MGRRLSFCGSDPVFRQIPTGTVLEKTGNSLDNKRSKVSPELGNSRGHPDPCPGLFFDGHFDNPDGFHRNVAHHALFGGFDP